MLRSIFHLILADHRFRRLGGPLLLVGLLAFCAGVAIDLSLRHTGSPSTQAERLLARGDLEGAERLRCDVLAEHFDFDVYFDLIEARVHLPVSPLDDLFEMPVPAVDPSQSADADARDFEEIEESPTCTDSAGRTLDLAELSNVASEGSASGPRVTRFWHRLLHGLPSDALRAELMTLAASTEPPRWTWHVLARAALLGGDLAEAARRFDLEGRAHPEEASGDRRRALELWAHVGDWDAVRSRAGDPLYRDAFTLRLRTELAEEDRDWATFLIALWPSTFEGVQPGPVLLAALAAILWLAFVGRLGQIRDDLAPRLALYGGAFLLGVLSIYPTLLVITAQDALLGWDVTGEPVRDAIYFVFGVGFREELCKLLLYLPLLPLLLKRGSRLEALTCGAMVGLGFAAEENISYFQHGDPSTALARFMTANFLHMALTGTLAAAVYDAFRARHHRPAAPGEAHAVFATVVLLHGAYDFLLGLDEFSYFAMTVFVFLSQVFLRQLVACRSVSGQDLMRHFAVSLAVLAGAGFVYASALYGPGAGSVLVLQGFLGVALLIFMFEREIG